MFSANIESLAVKDRFHDCCKRASRESFSQNVDTLLSVLGFPGVLSSGVSVGEANFVDDDRREFGVSAIEETGGKVVDKAKAPVPGKAGAGTSRSLYRSTLPEDLLRAIRCARDLELKTHVSVTFALTHRWQGDPDSESADGIHRSFWPRQRSHEARRGGLLDIDPSRP